MTIELLPLGTTCNIKCRYCYQEPSRGQTSPCEYDLDKMLESALKFNSELVLFGGEPLLLPMDDLEKVWAASHKRYGRGGIQTNGTLLTVEHIDLIKKYNVHVGISVDGPAALNDARWAGTLELTRLRTQQTHDSITLLIDHELTPGLIITLHRHNASPERLPEFIEWLRHCAAVGISSVRLHLLQVQGKCEEEQLVLTEQENLRALRAVYEASTGFPELRIDLFEDVRHLFTSGSEATCTWSPCDVYASPSCVKIAGDGDAGGCLRGATDGVFYKRARKPMYGRALWLYDIPQSQNGCQDCRWFLFCNGQCPGTGIDGDWRNRSAYCEVYKGVFQWIEQEFLDWNEQPLSLHPRLKEMERLYIERLAAGTGYTLQQAVNWIRADDADHKKAPCEVPVS